MLGGALIGILLASPALAASAAARESDERLLVLVPTRPGEPTRMLAANAETSAGNEVQRGENGARLVTGWGRDRSSSISWRLDVAEAGEYVVGVLLDHASGPDVVIELRAGAGTLRIPSRATGEGVRYRAARLKGVAPLHLGSGSQRLALDVRVSGAGPLDLGVFSVELMRERDIGRYRSRVMESRASTDAFVAMGHGFMVHYTPEAYPRNGPRKPFAEAVRHFDVEAFADQMKRGGAGFVVFVTAHMQWMFPAPLRTVDAQIPGRTTDRDLIDELERALARRGIRLMLYLNPARDAAFRSRLGDGPGQSARFLQAWNATVTELGERYGTRIVGYWFDQGPWFYDAAPSWEELHRVTRVGNPQRIVGWNRSRLPTLTEFQDFDSCEKCDDPSAGGYLPAGGVGRYLGGPFDGLQAAATLLGEDPPEGESADPWVHRWPDKAVGPPRWNARDLASLLEDFKARRNVPIFNLGIYQEGNVSARSIEVFAEATRLRNSARTP
jgi:hypothetical protein